MAGVLRGVVISILEGVVSLGMVKSVVVVGLGDV